MTTLTTNTSFGVIDIGSNSIRLVVFDGAHLTPIPIFNEKSVCGLATGLNKSGKMGKKNRAEALRAIGRFIRLTQFMKVSKLHIFATSAVRDASDGAAFVTKIHDEFGHDVEIISEAEEAFYAAMGVVSSFEKPVGLVGDLGGGSFELSHLNLKESADFHASFPLGPLRFDLSNAAGFAAYKEAAQETLKAVPLKKMLKGKSFYAVGGAFRNIAAIHMGRTKYPLKVLHHYQPELESLRDTLNIITRMSTQSLKQLYGVSKRRVHVLPCAAYLLNHVIEQGKASAIAFSTYGVREGILYRKLQKQERKSDPLIAGAYALADRQKQVERDYSAMLEIWLKPLITEDIAPRIIRAAVILSDIAVLESKSYRADIAYQYVLDSSLVALTHEERLLVATILFHRYDGTLAGNIDDETQSILPLKWRLQARALGLAMRLARALSASTAEGLEGSALTLDKKKLSLDLPSEKHLLVSQNIEKRIVALAELLNRTPQIICK